MMGPWPSQKMHQLEIPMARANDPASSFEAADHMVVSGKRGEQLGAVLDVVTANPGHTSLELTLHCELDRYQIARRLPELEEMELVRRGDVRKCDVGTRTGVTWWVKE